MQGPSYPDLSSPVVIAELAPLTESQNGAHDVVADKNEGEEEKIEVVMLEELSYIIILRKFFFFSLRVFINTRVCT